MIVRALDLASLAGGARLSTPDVWRRALGCGIGLLEGVRPAADIVDSIGFSEEDAAALIELKRRARGDLDAIASGMRQRMLGAEISPGAFDEAVSVWLTHLFDGSHDGAYFESRGTLAAGRVLAGLPTERLLAGLHLLRLELLGRSFELSTAWEATRAAEAATRLLDVELSILLAVKEARGAVPELTTLLLEGLPVRSFLVDARGRVAAHTPLAGPACRPGLTDAVGARLEDVLSPGLWQRAEVHRWLVMVRESGGEVVVPRTEVSEGESVRSYRVTLVALEQGGAGDVLVHIEDLTEAIADEGRARHAWHVAQLGIMASAVAHEIRNPLTGIAGTLQVIEGTLPLEDERRVALAKVSAQVFALGRVVADLVLFARPIRAERRDVDLALVVVETCEQLAAEGVVSVSGGGRAVADRALVARALTSLIDNARQAGAEQVAVDVATGRVEVHDDGPGVPDLHRERIFEPFFTTRTRGAGLGLPIAKRSVEAMGGRLALCASRLGGAAFRISLGT